MQEQDLQAPKENYPICEVRMPTYKRPKTLLRALKSLQEQTYPHWKAIVFDNSSEQEAKSVVADLNDDRIIYRPHAKNIGGPKNLDLSLQSKSILGGKYACMLEDDNYLYPDTLRENIETLKREKVNILLRNQETRFDEDDGTSKPTGKTTRGKWFKQGVYSPLELYASMFFCEGLSVGGLFWDAENIKTDFTLGDFSVQDSWYQEIFRSLRVVEPIYFDARLGSVYTIIKDYQSVGRGSKLPALLATPAQYNKATQAILRYLLKVYGAELIQKAKVIANYSEENLETLEHQLLNILYINYPFESIALPKRVLLLCKHFIRERTSSNDLQTALKESLPTSKA